MYKLLNATIDVILFCIVCALPASARIPNHSLFYMNDKRAPLTTLKVFFLGAGSGRDGHGSTGLAQITSVLIRNYADKHGYTADLAALGTDFDVITSFRYHAISISTLSRHFGASVRIISDMMNDITFSDSALEEAKKRLKTSYRNSVRSHTHRLITNLALVESRGIQKWRSLRALEHLRLDEIRDYYAGLLAADRVLFRAISDLDSTEVEASIRPFVAKRRTDGFVRSPLAKESGGLPGQDAYVFQRYSHLKNVYCYWLIPCGTVEENHYIPNMVSWALGQGGTGGLLYRYLREELELVYGTACSYRSMNDLRYLEISADPQIANSGKLLTKMSEFIHGLVDDDRFWNEIAEMRENPYYVRASSRKAMTPQNRLDDKVHRAIFNSPKREGGIKSVTDAEIRSFLEEFFVPENMVTIFLGPEEHTVELLKKHWPDITIHVQPVEKAIE